LSLAGVINVVLNLFFVTIMHLNVAGVALATTISQAISAILVVITLMRRTDSCKLQLGKMRFYKPQLMKMVRIGLPAGIQGSLFSISNVIIQSSINSFGEAVMSGNAAAGNIDGFLYVIMNAFHQTTVNFVGQNIGAHQYARAKKTLFICLGCVLVLGVSSSIAAYAFAPQLLSIYITDSAEAISYGVLRMSVVCITYWLCGLMETTTGALRGMGASMVPMLISVLGVCGVRLGWIFTVFQMPQFHSPKWLYISYPVSWTFTFLAQFIAFILVYRKRMQTDSRYVMKSLDAQGQ
jgi:Na+-driven multidrug efflux pump